MRLETEDLGFGSRSIFENNCSSRVVGNPAPRPTNLVSFIDQLVKDHLWVATTCFYILPCMIWTCVMHYRYYKNYFTVTGTSTVDIAFLILGHFYSCIFTHVYPGLLVFSNIYTCFPMFTTVHSCLPMFTYFNPCLLVMTYVYSCLPMFTTV